MTSDPIIKQFYNSIHISSKLYYTVTVWGCPCSQLTEVYWYCNTLLTAAG